MCVRIHLFSASFLRYFLLVLFFADFSSDSLAQNRSIDSLKALLPNLPQDSNRVWTLVRLARQFLPLRDTQTVIYATEAYELAEKINFEPGKASAAVQLGRFSSENNHEMALSYFHEAIDIFRNRNNKGGVAACYNNIGIIYFYQNRYDSAIANYSRSLVLYEALGFQDEVAKLTGNIGICYETQGYYTRALEFYLEALKINETNRDTGAIAIDLSNIAVVYKKQDDLENSLSFNQRALEMFRVANDRFGEAIVLVNMGDIYMDKGDFEKALEIANQAVIAFRELRSVRGEANAFHNIGEIHLRQKNFAAAIINYKRALSIKGNDNTLEGYVSLAEAYAGAGRPDSALYYGKQGLAMAEKLKSHESSFKAAKVLYQIYKTRNDHRSALMYHEKYLASKDSLFNEEKTAQFRELQTKYETEKKEQQIAILSSEKALQDNKLKNRALWLSASVGATLLIIVFAFVVIRVNRKRQQSEQQLLQEQLKIERMEAEKLQELDELKSRFFANIAHEFKTPLTLISGPVDNLLVETRDKFSKDQLLLVKRNSARLLSLINQLLDLSKLESGVIGLHLQKDDIITFLKGLTFSFQSLADEKDITLECHTSLGHVQMDFDRDKMEKIMFNLLSNAFKFTPALGKVQVSIERVPHNGAEAMKVMVRDSGIGIPEEQLPFIFNRFYQADNTQIRNSEGSGIGLALTKELIELHNGHIHAESTSGKGTVFSLLLPLQDDPAVHRAHATDELPGVQKGIELLSDSHETSDAVSDVIEKQEIVLVIEDNREVRDFVINSLRSTYQVIAASSGDEGIGMAIAQIPDLIISDVMMPGKNGYETCRLLKEDERTSHIPVILLTAKAGIENKIEGLETGADDFIPKPFNTRELLTRIKNLITTRKKLREKFLNTVLEDEKPVKATIEDAFLKKLREAIESNLDNAEFSIEDLSREVGMSRTQVHRKLKALTNQSASQFMRTIRLQHGKTLLQEGNLNVSEVAYRVGFSSPTYFSTCYASQFGYAPSEEKVG